MPNLVTPGIPQWEYHPFLQNQMRAKQDSAVTRSRSDKAVGGERQGRVYLVVTGIHQPHYQSQANTQSPHQTSPPRHTTNNTHLKKQRNLSVIVDVRTNRSQECHGNILKQFYLQITEHSSYDRAITSQSAQQDVDLVTASWRGHYTTDLTLHPAFVPS